MNETPDLIGWRMGASILIECKVSRTDFLKDRKKVFRKYPSLIGLGQKRFYLCPANLIQVSDLPKDWGLLWINKNRIFVQAEANPQEYSKDAEIRFLVSMLRRTQIRIGARSLSEWLYFKNRNEGPAP